MSEKSDTFKLVNAMELAKTARVGLELTYFDVIELLGELESLKDYIAELEAERRWIPVSERLPEYKTPYDYVLVCDATDGGYAIAWRETPGLKSGQVWCFSADLWIDEDVTHWMPLPEPPEVEE